MWVIYANDISGDLLYVGEDEIVNGINNLYKDVSRAITFKTKEDARKYVDIRESELKHLGVNLFVAQVTVNRGTTDYVGYFGKDLKRFN